jgi:arginase
MTAVDLICCPYDLGRRNWRCGLGPTAILQHDALTILRAAGADLRLVDIETQIDYESETGLVFEAQRMIAENVAKARQSGRLPLVLGGNCNTAVGGVSGIGGSRLGVLWFDAHGDFCTPETTDSGFLDGMGLAMVVGRCWRNLLSSIPGYAPIPEVAVALIGARALDPLEKMDLAGSGITNLLVEEIRAKGVRGVFEPFLDRLVQDVDKVYLHVDLDVLEPKEASVNQYDAPGGLRPDEVREAIALVGQHIHVAGGGLGSYDPSVDPTGKTADIAVGILETLIATYRTA